MEMKAVGRRCMKAVAMSTPVPKCLETKRYRCGIGRDGKRLATTGKAHAEHVSTSFAIHAACLPIVLTMSMRNTAKT